MTGVLTKTEGPADQRRAREDRGRDWGDAAAGHRTAQLVSSLSIYHLSINYLSPISSICNDRFSSSHTGRQIQAADQVR